MPKNKSWGFTLVEILVVVSLIGILITASIVLLNPAKQLAKSNDAKRKSDLRTIQSALEQYRADNGVYPKFFVSSTGAYVYGHAEARFLSFNTSEITYINSFPEAPKVGKLRCDQVPAGKYYGYVYSGGPNSYTLFTTLENESDSLVSGTKDPPTHCPVANCSPSNITASWPGGSCHSRTYNYWVNSP